MVTQVVINDSPLWGSATFENLDCLRRLMLDEVVMVMQRKCENSYVLILTADGLVGYVNHVKLRLSPLEVSDGV